MGPISTIWLAVCFSIELISDFIDIVLRCVFIFWYGDFVTSLRFVISIYVLILSFHM